MGVFEGEEAIKQAEEELEHRWTRYRSLDTVEVIAGHKDFIGQIFTIKFPYYFLIEGEQAYIVNGTPYPFKESELKFVKQEIYIQKKEEKV